MAKIFDLFSVVRSGLDGLQRQVSDATSLSFVGEKSMTHQEFADDCDINTIMARYEQSGVDARDLLEDVLRNGRFGDCTVLHENYHNAMQFVAEAGEAFDALPAKMRSRFHNDPKEMLAFVDNPENRDEAIRLGLFSAPMAQDNEGGVTPPGASKEASVPSE